MTQILQLVIVVEWFLLIIGGVIFLAVYGPPWRYADREMAWHLYVAALAAVLQPVAYILAGLSLWPAAVTELVATVLIYWRLTMLIQGRRRRVR